MLSFQPILYKKRLDRFICPFRVSSTAWLCMTSKCGCASDSPALPYMNCQSPQEFLIMVSTTSQRQARGSNLPSMVKETATTTGHPARRLPQFPTEIWLQILEDISDPLYLWTRLRHFSPTFESYVDKTFLSTYLPRLLASAAMPRRDPSTSALRYQHFAPEIIFRYAAASGDGSHVILKTPKMATNGSSMRALNETGVLSQQRLEEAVMWVSIECSRAKATPLKIEKKISWDEEGNVWVWKVDWKELVERYFEVKKTNLERSGNANINSQTYTNSRLRR